MAKDTLKQLLLNEVNKTEGWLSKGSLYCVAESEEYSPEHCGRALRLLAEEGKILVSYYLGKRKQKLARYAKLDTVKPLPSKPKYEEVEVDGQRFMKIIS